MQKGHAPAVDYRDWGREDPAPRERYPTDAWGEGQDRQQDTLASLLNDDGLQPGGPYAPTGDSYPTPSRRRGASQDDADRYTPAWASEPETRPAPYEAASADPDGWRRYLPATGARWETTETTSSWHRTTETDWRLGPVLDGAAVSAPASDDPGGRGGSGGSRRGGDVGASLLGLRDPLPDAAPPVGRRRAPEDPPRSGAGRRRAVEDAAPPVAGRRRAIESGESTQPGRRRAAPRPPSGDDEGGAPRRRRYADDDADPPVGGDRAVPGRRRSAEMTPPATVRRARPTTYGQPRDRPIDGGVGAVSRPGDADEPGGEDRRGRFIEATGWGKSADTTEWERATADERLYRSPETARRDRAAEGGRRGRSGDGDAARRSRSDTRRSGPSADTRRSGPSADTRRGDRPTSGASGWASPTSGASGWTGPTSGAGRAGRSGEPADGWQRASGGGAGWTAGGGGWGASRETGQWDRFTDTGQWDRFTDTGQWDRFTDTTEWRQGQLAGLVEQDSDEGGSWADGRETFWSGTRLAGDDPRWVEAPESAPRSPAAGYSESTRSRPVSPARPERVARLEPATPVRTTARPPSYATRSSSYATRGGLDSVSTRRRSTRRIEDDLLDAHPGSPLTAVLYAAAWYAVPVLVLFVWLLALDGGVPAGCVTDVIGGGCESPRAKAMASLLGAAPRFGLAMMVSLVTAVLLRWASPTWRSGSVGLAAAVIGGGMSTVLVSVISGQALG